MIRLQKSHTAENYLQGFWQWVQLLVDNNYEGALEALYWPNEVHWTPTKLKERITTFFGGEEPWSVIIPNERLTAVVNDSFEYQEGWFLGLVPLTTMIETPKADDIPLMGLGTSFFVREHDGAYVMQHEIFHA